MSEPNDKTIALNIRLKPSDSSVHPRAANYTNVGMAQSIVYLDVGFIEPAVLAGIAKTAKDGQAVLKSVEGHLVTRVAMDVSALARFQQEIQQTLVSVGIVQKAKAKGSDSK